MKLTKIFVHFLRNEQAGGIILICCTVISLSLATIFPAYAPFWHLKIGSHSLTHWINDGLMTIFFLLIGLELEREVYNGELSTLKNALLPVIAAVGGMLLPACIYYALNFSSGTLRGLGIPMATDIAFALSVLLLLGKRIPTSLKVFLTALAVIDDLGAIIVIAIFYTATISWINLGIAFGILFFLFVLNRLKVYILFPYLVGGAVAWYFMLHSGVHATLTGVLLAFVIPFDKGDSKSISIKLEEFLHKPVAFFILPLFALANTSVLINSNFYLSLGSTISLGVMLGLYLGKPLGIFLFSFLATKLKICSLPEDLNWKQIWGAGILGGIGFTMSIFITLLAFSDTATIEQTKISIMLASVFSGLSGYIFLRRS